MNNLIEAYPSKNHFQRLILAAALSNKHFIINNYPRSTDAIVIIKALKELGYSIYEYENYIEINSQLRKFKIEYFIDCKDSGFAIRVLPLIFMNENSKFHFYFDTRILDRNIDEIFTIFNNLDIKYQIKNNLLEYKGNLAAKDLEINGSISSQFITGLLYNISFNKYNYKLLTKNTSSKGYVEYTLKILEQFGKNFLYINNVLKLEKNSEILSYNLEVDGDWSGAAFFIILGLILGNLGIKGLRINSGQPDEIIYHFLKSLNYNIDFKNDILIINKCNLKGFSFDANHNPDLVPPLVILALFSNKESIIYNVGRLKYKESNRILELVNGIKQLNGNINYKDGNLYISKSNLSYKQITYANDHRIIMTFAIIQKILTKEYIEPNYYVNKSNPLFFNQLNSLYYE